MVSIGTATAIGQERKMEEAYLILKLQLVVRCINFTYISLARTSHMALSNCKDIWEADSSSVIKKEKVIRYETR